MISRVDYEGDNIVSYVYATKADVEAKYGVDNTLENMKSTGVDVFANWIAPAIQKAGPNGFATIDEIVNFAKANFLNLLEVFEYNEKNDDMKNWEDWALIARTIYVFCDDASGKFKTYRINSIEYTINQ